MYHYASDRQQLEQIRHGVRARRLEQYLPEQDWFQKSAALILFSAVFQRTLWRYNYSRAYRAVLIEAGHLCQTFCLTATWLGLAPFCSVALGDKAIEQDLGLDGISESVLYAAGVGSRDAAGGLPMVPDGERAPRLIPNPVFSEPVQRKYLRRRN